MALAELLNPELQKRILSSVVLAPIVVIALLQGGVLFDIIMVVGAIIMSFEWSAIIHSKPREEIRYKTWFIGGIAYCACFAVSMIYLRDENVGGFGTVFALLLTVWATDIMAYFTGKIVKGPKILPAVSPNKTWSGLIGGMVAAALTLGSASVFFDNGTMLKCAMLGACIAILAQIGDFFESWMKRHFDIKDSGWIIPGHGGILDRVDGLMAVFPIAALAALLKGGALF